MIQLAAESQTDMKHQGSPKHASWQKEHDAPIAEMTLLEFRKDFIDVGMLKSAASKNIIGCGGGRLFRFYSQLEQLSKSSMPRLVTLRC